MSALMALLFVAMPVAAQAGGSGGSRAARGPIGVQPGDEVVIEFYTAAGTRLDEVAGERIVDQNGELFLPYVGTIRVANLTASDIRELLLQRYGSFYEEPVVDVRTKFRVNVTGAVRAPGNYLVEPTTTIMDVVSRAGGLGTSVSAGVSGGAADASRIHLFRGGATNVLDLRAGRANPATLRMLVRSGDWIWVPAERQSVWRENLSLIGGVLSIAASVVWIVTVAK